MEWIFKRRSIRKFTAEKVTDSEIQTLLESAMAAPSAMNLKPWKFIVVREEQTLEALRAALPFGKYNAPLAIVVCGDLTALKKVVTERFWIQDCSAATENILLAAAGMGLGSVWCGVHPVGMLEKAVAKALDIPKGVVPLNAVFIGHPAETKEPRTQYSAKNVFQDKYGKPWED